MWVLRAADDGELVAGETGDDVTGFQHLGQPTADLDEQVVAGMVAQRVVDLLEPVEVEHDDERAHRALTGTAEHPPVSARTTTLFGRPVSPS